MFPMSLANTEISFETAGIFCRKIATEKTARVEASSGTSDLNELLNALEMSATSAVEWECMPGWNSGRLSAPQSMWLYVREGYGVYRDAGRGDVLPFGPGKLVLIAKHSEYELEADDLEKVSGIVVHFEARVFGAMDLLSLLGLPSILDDERQLFAVASERLLSEFTTKLPGWAPAMDAELTSVLFALVRNSSLQRRVGFGAGALAELPRFLPVFRHIEKNLHRPEYAVLEMAREAHLSEVQFRKIFRRLTGSSPLRFVQRRRIERACSLLHTSTESISLIAEASGFCEPPFFYRVFKAWTGTTPRSYRKASKPLDVLGARDSMAFSVQN